MLSNHDQITDQHVFSVISEDMRAWKVRLQRCPVSFSALQVAEALRTLPDTLVVEMYKKAVKGHLKATEFFK